jgi:hypothetical protein
VRAGVRVTDITQSPRFQADMVLEADPLAPERLWYMSFCDGDRPKGEQFLGSLYIRGKSFCGAVSKSHLLGLNPGGEILFVEVPLDVASRVPEEWIGRLLSREELAQQDAAMAAR